MQTATVSNNVMEDKEQLAKMRDTLEMIRDAKFAACDAEQGLAWCQVLARTVLARFG